MLKWPTEEITIVRHYRMLEANVFISVFVPDCLANGILCKIMGKFRSSGLTVIILLSQNFVLEKQPIRTSHPINTAFGLNDFGVRV